MYWMVMKPSSKTQNQGRTHSIARRYVTSDVFRRWDIKRVRKDVWVLLGPAWCKLFSAVFITLFALHVSDVIHIHPQERYRMYRQMVQVSARVSWPVRKDVACLETKFFSVAPQTNSGLSSLTVDVCRSHIIRYTHTVGRTPLDEWSARHRDRYLRSKRQTKESSTHVLSEIRTRNPNKRAAADPRFRPRGHWVGALKYRVIHKSLRDFRTRLRNNQDIRGRKERINR